MILLLRLAIPLAVVLIAWLAAGRQVVTVLDRIVPVPAVPLATGPIAYDGGGLVIGGKRMVFASTDNQRAPVELAFDSGNRTILSWQGKTFVLGPRLTPVDSSGIPDFDFTAEAGDELSFTERKSLISWPTPFEFNFLGGRSPSWKRYVYYRLTWKKRSGASLAMYWRYEQRYYSGAGWGTAEMMWMSKTGLISVKIAGN